MRGSCDEASLIFPSVGYIEWDQTAGRTIEPCLEGSVARSCAAFTKTSPRKRLFQVCGVLSVHRGGECEAREEGWVVIVLDCLGGRGLCSRGIRLKLRYPDGQVGKTSGDEDLLPELVCNVFDVVRIETKLGIGEVVCGCLDRDVMSLDILVELRDIRIIYRVVGVGG